MNTCTILTEERESMLSDVCTNNGEKLWKHGVPYVFNDNVNKKLKRCAKEAMKQIEKESGVRFLERKEEKDYIEIIDRQEFASYVGRIGGKQELHVSKDENEWPNLTGNIMHELMHVLGFHHEHSHPERDAYLNVIATGINYDKQKKSNTVCIGPYDPISIMHYPLSPDKMTLREEMHYPLSPDTMALREKIDVDKIGQRNHLSEGDKNALRLHYPRSTESEMIDGFSYFS